MGLARYAARGFERPGPQPRPARCSPANPVAPALHAVAEGGFAIAKLLVPPATVCTGAGCAADATAAGARAALQLSDIGASSLAYWGALLLVAGAGEARLRTLAQDPACGGRAVFDPLRLWVDAEASEQRRLELAEVKHGRLAMVALATHWGTKLAAASGSVAAAAAAGVPARGFTFAHQLWGQTCVYNVMQRTSVCLPQATNDAFDFVLSWEIWFRTLTGYFREPYF